MRVIESLKKLGCKVVARETTVGAMQWWLSIPQYAKVEYKDQVTKKQILKAVGIEEALGEEFWAFGLTGRDPVHSATYRGDGFTIAFQTEETDGHSGLFVAKPRICQCCGQPKAGKDFSPLSREDQAFYGSLNWRHSSLVRKTTKQVEVK